MNIASTPAVSSAVAATQAPNSDMVQVLVLKKALDTEAAAALTLLQALPQALATQGPLGTQLDTFA